MDSLRRLPTTTLSRRFARKIVNPSTPGMDNASIVASVIGDAGKTSHTGPESAAADAAIAKSLGSISLKTDPALNLPASLFLGSIDPDPDVAKSLAADAIVAAAVSVTSVAHSASAISIAWLRFVGQFGCVMRFRPIWHGQGPNRVMQLVGLTTRVSLIQKIPIGVIHGQDWMCKMAAALE